MSLRVSIRLPLAPAAAFDAICAELALGLEQRGMEFRPGEAGGIRRGGREVARLRHWRRPEAIELEWPAEAWQGSECATVRLRFAAEAGGARVELEHGRPAMVLGGEGEGSGGELAGWFADVVLAPLLAATTPEHAGDWLTDRRARRPAGALARGVYRDPIYHRPNFLAILQALALTAGDYLLEVGCGGGAFLHEALACGCRAAAVDHSPAMLRVAREVNAQAVGAGRLEIHQADAAQLPFADATFTLAATTGVFGFLPDPRGALSEVHRTLASGGRLALFTGWKELRGTPAAPEPMASRLRFYDDAELQAMARGAGFGRVSVERPDLEGFAIRAGLPEEAIPLFRGGFGGQLLLARKE